MKEDYVKVQKKRAVQRHRVRTALATFNKVDIWYSRLPEKQK